MRQSNTNIPNISNAMILDGMRRARVERSKAMYSLINNILGRNTRPNSR